MTKCDVNLAVAEYLRGGAALFTRVREGGSGAVHDAPWGVPGSLGVSAIASDLMEVLESLEAEGIVERREEVHPHDSSEYRVTWVLVGAQA